MQENAFNDHLKSFKKLLDSLEEVNQPKKLLEFGLGESTMELVKLFDHVHSVELYTGVLVPKDWFYSIERKLKDNPKWSGELIDMPETLRNVEVEIRQRNIVNNRLWDPESQMGKDIKEIVVNAINNSEADIVFVDAGSHCRGEIVRYIMDNHMDLPVNFIVVHDTNWGDNRYNYRIIPEFKNGSYYEDWVKRQYFKDGSGTTIYFRSVTALKKYKERMAQNEGSK